MKLIDCEKIKKKEKDKISKKLLKQLLKEQQEFEDSYTPPEENVIDLEAERTYR